MTERAAFPHCDTRILHAPSTCEYCDMYPDWQELRHLWGIAFTGCEPEQSEWGHQLPCPADFNRPPDSPSDHRQWAGNTPQGFTWPAGLTATSGDRGRPAKRRRWGRNR